MKKVSKTVKRLSKELVSAYVKGGWKRSMAKRVVKNMDTPSIMVKLQKIR